MKYFLILILCVLASCKSVCTTNGLQTTPDVLNKTTDTVIAKDTTADLPKGSHIKTDSDKKTEVTLEHDTVVIIKPEPSQEPIIEKPQEVIVPKNTTVILPENTSIQTADTTKINIEAQTEVQLPVGTEVKMSRVNWYALLFYLTIIFGLAWYYLQGKGEDKDGDGFVDQKKKLKNRK
jgi:hypothetical protein